MKKLVIATLMSLLLAGFVQSTDVTDYAKLAELKAEMGLGGSSESQGGAGEPSEG